MRRVRVSCLLFVGLLSLPARSPATVTAYEWVTQGGRNNVIDSNAESCDHGPFSPAGTWSGPGEGCYDRLGARCSANPGHSCDLQVVPKGRCTYGSLSLTGGPGGTPTCVWPHGAGRCGADTHVGCLSDAYVADPTSTASGPSTMCVGTRNSLCDMSADPYGGPFRADCACDGENAAAPNFELAVCGSSGGAQALCSDGDPDRGRGGYGLALGIELNVGSVLSFALGPVVNGSAVPSTSPRYPLENPLATIQPQRDGEIALGLPNAGAVLRLRTTEARDATVLDPTLGVYKLRALGDSYWADVEFEPQPVSGAFAAHSVLLPCDAPVGWSTAVKIDPTPSAPNGGDERYCSQLARDSLAIAFARDLTPAERAANPTCPPSCGKDFDLTTTEFEAIQAAEALDANAGLQLALQSGEGRPAGAGDVISATPRTLVELLNTSDHRCRLGGWGNPPGYVGRCSDGPTVCVPGDPTRGDSLCGSGQCRACNGPVDPIGNPLGLPIGYDTHGLPELDLVAGHRIGMLAGYAFQASLPLFFVGTTGYSAAEFRDLPGTGVGTLDLADLGAVDPLGAPFAAGIGAGGTFANGVTLPIGESCCASGADVVWGPAQVGTPVTTLLRTFDAGPGPDGIPACIGDNSPIQNGANACNQRLGVGPTGPKTDGAFNTGLDDVAETFPVGASGTIPASSARFGSDWSGVPPPRF